ncbi:MAG TPA: protein kinase [Polyangiales bacterium]|nr:protein kinase [Polyangiales bacterium]
MRDAHGAPPPAAGVIGGRFVVESTLGRGGMAAVYRVRDVRSGQRFALKRVWARDPQHAAKRRVLLEREFQTLAHLRHPRIIEVYDYGVDPDGPFYTMELLDGSDLDQGGKLPWREACGLLRDIASSLAIVHSRGLIHRDVSARNVRRTADGRAKLIDFGGMISMGVAADVVGTPPYMPPEALQNQALDARADLFSLGALGYYLLVGRHAYPARRSSELRDAWRSRPAPPSRSVSDVPAALSTQILQLLALDRGARPQHAAEVMERLCVIADLPKEDLSAIQRGYLTTPTLVGRDQVLLAVRNHMLSLMRGDGGALALEGPPGSGRSRMCDACAFEGKLLSAVVVRTAGTPGGEAWSIARSLASQLFHALPEASLDATRLSAGVLSHLVEELRGDGSVTATVTFPERSLLLRELRDYVLALARKHRLVIVVDDADSIDDASTAWLAALADKASRQSVLVVLGMEPERGGEPTSLHVLRSMAQHIALPPLGAAQSESLLRSVFGDVPNLGFVAGRIHAVAQGNPRATIELAQHLVDRGLARYESGNWLLPQQLSASDLPETLERSLMHRLDELSADARELAEAFSIADVAQFPPATYRSFTQHADQQRVFRGLEELVSARVLVTSDASYRFSQRGFASVLAGRMTEARRVQLHGRLADLLARSGGDVMRRAEHLLAAKREAEAVQLLCSLDLMVRLPALPMLVRAVACAEQKKLLPARALHRLHMALLAKASLVMELEVFRRYLPVVLAQLERDTGLALYNELTNVPENERLSRALTTQQERYLATPEREQVHAVGDAIRELARLTGMLCGLAGATFDRELLQGLPSLEPLLPLSPALRIMQQLCTATVDWLSGRADRAGQIYAQTLERLAEPDRAGLDDTQHERTQLAVSYVLALYEASLGLHSAEERAQFMESRRALRVNAWRVRALLQLNQGDAAAAHKSLHRAELLQLQDESETYYPGTGVGLYVVAYFLAEDFIGVKRTLDQLSQFSEQHPGWGPMRVFGESCLRFLTGDLAGALERVLAGLSLVQPGEHMTWTHLAVQRVRVLRELGRLPEALEHGQQYLELMRRRELAMTERFMVLEMARALSTSGRDAEALALLEPLIARVEARGARGLALGVFFEARARIALAMRDRAAFERYSERCAFEYDCQNPALSAKFARLMEEARQLEIAPPDAPTFERKLLSVPAPGQADEESTIVSRIQECVDTSDRARVSLTMLLQSGHSYVGYLYGVSGEQLRLLAGVPVPEAEPELDSWLVRWFAAERERAGADTEQTISENHEEDPTQYLDPDGKIFQAILLVDDRYARPMAAAALVLQVDPNSRRRPALRLMRNIAELLIDRGDVQGAPLGSER